MVRGPEGRELAGSLGRGGRLIEYKCIGYAEYKRRALRPWVNAALAMALAMAMCGCNLELGQGFEGFVGRGIEMNGYRPG